MILFDVILYDIYTYSCPSLLISFPLRQSDKNMQEHVAKTSLKSLMLQQHNVAESVQRCFYQR